MLSKSELRSSLDELEAEATAGRSLSIDRLDPVESAAKYWAEYTRRTFFLRRLAKLYKTAGQPTAAMAQLEIAYAIDDTAKGTVRRLSSALDDAGQGPRAMEVLSPLLERRKPTKSVLKHAAAIAGKLGEQDKSVKRRRNPDDAKHLPGLIADLTAAHKGEEALAEARKALQGGIADPNLAYRCYVALSEFSHDEAEIGRALSGFMAAAAGSPDGAIWRARYHRREDRFEEAIAEIKEALRSRPDDPQLRRELASQVLAHGHWGRDAQALVDVLPSLKPTAGLRSRIVDADVLLHAFGGSLEDAAANPSRFAHVTSPKSVFDHVADGTPPSKDAESRRGIVMVAPSLAAGDAERALATCFRRMSGDARFGWAKLYLFDLSPDADKDFFLPLTGLSRSDVIVLDRDCEVHAPLSWLPVGQGRKAQRILDRLNKDRPAVVHAWLEPLNTIAGLSALLAGVPKIVLQTHSMCPATVNPKGSSVPRLRDSYRALLRRPEVSLVCCADAAAREYVQWLGLPDSSKIHTLHDCFNSEDIESAGNRQAVAELRASFGIGASAPVVGTAFRFSEGKRPLRWVDAAALVLAERPDCRFVMFGDGKLRPATEEYIRAKGLSEHFTLPGFVSDLHRRLPLLDVFALSSSRTEALPGVLIEAQAAGVPVIAYNAGGIGEAMIDGVTGTLVKEDLAAALAAAILRALADPEWRKRASRAGKTFVKEQFGANKMFAVLSKILLKQNEQQSR